MLGTIRFHRMRVSCLVPLSHPSCKRKAAELQPAGAVDEELAWAEVTVKETALVQVRDRGERLVRERADLCGCEVGPM